ncbi:MAG: [LysW]-aminoadipate kinase [Thermanaerothrix sp.]|uniref:Putative [LysW]-aminoadipate kinase n=2 Tax=Thermanaerothrix TaxID=1077886 RepID=A0ABU3NM13_9CHLR|nr:[LysW]-aminoadipate kinase [Thermanaerothrix sp. 4228-RoL]MDT8897852.1 [LysW]-aminoadipate kinase [Thermanaerothrix sp. 4228-RoL]
MDSNGHLQTLVVKLGGTEGVDFAAICQDVVTLQREGWRMVLVHGGSAEANALGEALGHPPRFVTSPSGFTSRYTDRKTLEIFAAAVNGRVNTLLVEQLQALGINALGLSGLDGRLLVARRKEAIRIIENGRQKILRDDYTGTIETVNVALLRLLLTEGYVPVVAPLALSPQGEALNVDADRAAAMIAAALQAATLVLLTGAPGLLRAFPDESSLIPRLTLAEMERALGYAEGRMKKKVLGAQEALRGGVGRVIIADGRYNQPLLKALQGGGTWITP